MENISKYFCVLSLCHTAEKYNLLIVHLCSFILSGLIRGVRNSQVFLALVSVRRSHDWQIV